MVQGQGRGSRPNRVNQPGFGALWVRVARPARARPLSGHRSGIVHFPWSVQTWLHKPEPQMSQELYLNPSSGAGACALLNHAWSGQG